MYGLNGCEIPVSVECENVMYVAYTIFGT
jgi:hypothetical protein